MTQGRATTAVNTPKPRHAGRWRGTHETGSHTGARNHRHRSGHPHRRMLGTSLIEVLAAVFVLSTGMLGIAALNLHSKRASREALQRTTASHLARDIVERMRANRTALDRYVGTVDGHTGPAAIDCRSHWCNPVQLARFDLAQWAQALDGDNESSDGVAVGGLIGATGCIEGPATGADGIYTIAIAWRGGRALADPVLHDCGRGSGKYDDAAGNADVNRRVSVLALYMSGHARGA